MQLGRVLGSRGLSPAEVLQARPDLLTQNPGTVEAKLEQLPEALGMSRQRVRQLISQCPELLRRSVSTVSHRWAPGLDLWCRLGVLWAGRSVPSSVRSSATADLPVRF